MKEDTLLINLRDIDQIDEIPRYILTKADYFFYFLLAPIVLIYCSYHLIARCLRQEKLQIKQRVVNFLLIFVVYVKTSIEMFNAIMLTKEMDSQEEWQESKAICAVTGKALVFLYQVDNLLVLALSQLMLLQIQNPTKR